MVSFSIKLFRAGIVRCKISCDWNKSQSSGGKVACTTAPNSNVPFTAGAVVFVHVPVVGGLFRFHKSFRFYFQLYTLPQSAQEL